NDDPNGHFVATARMPEAGFWAWNVTLQDLATTQTPVPLTVLSRSGVAPALDTAALLVAIDRAKSEAITSITNQYGPEIDRLQGQAETYRTRIDNLNAQVRALTKERDTVAASAGSAEGTQGLSLLAVLSVSVLAGAIAGFVMSWLSGRGPRAEGSAVTLSATPRGVGPVWPVRGGGDRSARPGRALRLSRPRRPPAIRHLRMQRRTGATVGPRGTRAAWRRPSSGTARHRAGRRGPPPRMHRPRTAGASPRRSRPPTGRAGRAVGRSAPRRRGPRQDRRRWAGPRGRRSRGGGPDARPARPRSASRIAQDPR